MSFNFDQPTRDSWKNGTPMAPDGEHSATLLKCEILQSKKTDRIFIKWFFMIDLSLHNVEKISSVDGKNAGWTRSDLEYISKSEIPDIDKIDEILPLIRNIPCKIKVVHKDGHEFINIIKDKSIENEAF